MRSLILSILLLLGLSASAHAELASLFGIGPKNQAMGGVSLIQGESNPFQVYTAPAALGFLHRMEIDFGTEYFQPNIRPYGTLNLNSAGTQGDFSDAGVLPGGGSLLAFGIPLGRVHPVTLGGAIFMPFASLIRVSGTPVDYPFYPLYTDLSRNFFFVVGAGYEIWDGWAVGVNVRSTTKSTVSYSLRSDSSINYSASATEAKSESRLSYSVLYDNSRRHPEQTPWTAGAMYRGYAGMETKIQADVSAFVPIQGAIISDPSYTPAEWVLMGTWQAIPLWTLSGEVSRVMWSKYISPYGSGNINTYVIGDKASSANFNNITVFRAGLEHEVPVNGATVKKIFYRGGYQYHPSPVPDQTGDTNFVDTKRHLFSAGVGAGIANPWKDDDVIDLDLFFQYNLLKNRQISKSSNLNVGAPGYLAGGNILLFGGGASLKF
ncbi:MAG: OmpP1/FadL family transporter [Bdellovibrionota bacterium]